MTMRSPMVDTERNTPIVKTFDPAKRYRFTWPGQKPRVVTGEEMTALAAGADVSMLAIEEATSDTAAIDTLDSPVPEAFTGRGDSFR